MSITIDMAAGTTKEAIATLPEKMLDHAFEVLMKQAELIKGLAQVYAPVETGSLRDSIRVERGGESQHWRQVSVRAGGYITNPKTGKKVNYAHHMEYGTKYISGYFYLTAAVAEVQPTIADMIKANVVQKVTQP